MQVADRRVPEGLNDGEASRGVLWRAPTTLRNRIRQSAKSLDISQNAYITTTAIFGELMIARTVDIPDNVRRLFVHMNESVADGSRLVMDACYEEDWEAVYEALVVLSDANLLKDIIKRRPVIERRAVDRGSDRAAERVPETKVVVFGFTFTREGMQVWKLIGPLIVNLLEAVRSMKNPPLSTTISTG